jgi:hypothetical protein
MHRTTWRRSFIRRCTILIIERTGLRGEVARPDTLIPGDIRDSGVEGNGRKIHMLAVASRARHELNVLGADQQPSHTAIAINPTSASDIRYAVIGFSLEMKYAA